MESDRFKVWLDLTACSERKHWQGWINKAIWAQRRAKRVSAPRGKGYFSKRGCWSMQAQKLSYARSPKLSQLLRLGWVMQVSSSVHMQAVTRCLKITDKLHLLQPHIKSSSAGQGHVPTIDSSSLTSKAFFFPPPFGWFWSLPMDRDEEEQMRMYVHCLFS